MLGPRASCSTEGVDYHNFYDGINPRKVAPKKKTESAFTFTSESFRNMNPIEKCIQKAAVVATHISSKGGNGQLFWNMVMAVWGCGDTMSKPIVTMSIKEGASFKRISPSMTSRVHPIACFPNVYHCVVIESTSLGKYLSAFSTSTDYMSFITAARCFGLLEYACSNIRSDEIPFAILPGHLPIPDDTVLTVIDEVEVTRHLKSVDRNASTVFCSAVMASLVTKVTAVDDEEMVQMIEYSTGTHKETKKVSPVKIQVGFGLTHVTNEIRTRNTLQYFPVNICKDLVFTYYTNHC
jgi:hypothetical protein